MRNPLRRSADNTFRAKSASDLETVATKLDAAQHDLAAAEAEIRVKSLEAALADDPDEIMLPLRERLARARDHVQLLEDALHQAQQAESARVAGAADAAERARVKAIKGYTASLAKAGGEMRRGLEQILRAWQEMQRIAAKYEPLLRPGEKAQMFGHTAIESALTTLVALEMFRQAPNIAGLPLEPKGKLGLAPLRPHGASWSEVDPIEAQIERRFGIGNKTVSRARASVSDDTVQGRVGLGPAPAKPIVEPVGTAETEANWHDAEMRRVAALAAGDAPADDEDIDALQRQLAAEAAEAEEAAVTTGAAEE